MKYSIFCLLMAVLPLGHLSSSEKAEKEKDKKTRKVANDEEAPTRAEVKTELRAVTSIRKEDIRDLTVLFGYASIYLSEQWDESLAHNLARVFRLTMELDKFLYGTLGPMTPILVSDRKDEFTDLVLDGLENTADRELFLKSVDMLITQSREGNG